MSNIWFDKFNKKLNEICSGWKYFKKQLHAGFILGSYSTKINWNNSTVKCSDCYKNGLALSDVSTWAPLTLFFISLVTFVMTSKLVLCS